jgi:glucose 1-dehydrogenase
MFDQVEAEWGGVDILVNSAGVEIRCPALEFSEADYARILDTNLKAAFFCAQRALRGMKERGWGRVINISSIHEIKPAGWSIPYSMSKGGLAMMTRELAFEFSKFGITINSITPGAIRTDINREVLADPAYEAKVLTKIPAGFIGETTDVAALVAFLASDRARYITGASLFIDGGMAL